VVLGDAPVSHLVEVENPFDDAEWVFDLGPYTGLIPALLFL
jgi:hypothetical protein